MLQTVAQGAVSADLVSTLAARLTRLEREFDVEQCKEIAEKAGASIAMLAGNLLTSLDPDTNVQRAIEKFDVPEGEEPTEEQITEVEREQMSEALKPFYDPDLRDMILKFKAMAEQVIDEVTPDMLLQAGFDEAAKERAKSTLADFEQFIKDNKDEIEAIQVLYSRPYRAGLRYRQLKELKAAIEQPPLNIQDPEQRLWSLYEAVHPEKVKGRGGKNLVDLIAIVRHAINPDEPIVPVGMTVEERYQKWLAEQEVVGVMFTPEQRQWLDAIKDHIATSLTIDQDQFEYAPV